MVEWSDSTAAPSSHAQVSAAGGCEEVCAMASGQRAAPPKAAAAALRSAAAVPGSSALASPVVSPFVAGGAKYDPRKIARLRVILEARRRGPSGSLLGATAPAAFSRSAVDLRGVGAGDVRGEPRELQDLRESRSCAAGRGAPALTLAGSSGSLEAQARTRVARSRRALERPSSSGSGSGRRREIEEVRALEELGPDLRGTYLGVVKMLRPTPKTYSCTTQFSPLISPRSGVGPLLTRGC
eukprot:TRINITY_DN29476_c0_g1_i1.p1 TRINITY_DN29476_c0_g1~~TRINITY_DN29476_c0_g1_i1.p1  ORF type:complete len:240 (-),score=49.86 TRINITY_DN29476_c0_g1_i1:143-862(-)